jgi:hypothetical protein
LIGAKTEIAWLTLMRCLALLAASAPIAAASVTSDTYSILLSDTLPGNLLPQVT